jgi:Bacterial Ig-like domain (group 3)
VFAAPSTKKVVAKYSGNAHHKASSGTATIKVTNKPTTGGGGGPIATTTTLTSPSNAAYSHVNAGQQFTLTATVAPTSGNSDPTGTVAFTVVDWPGPGPVPSYLPCTTTLTAAEHGNAQCTITTVVPNYGFVLYEATYTPAAGSEWTTSNSAGTGDHKLVTWDITSTLLTFGPAAGTTGDPVTLTADVTDQGLDALASAAPTEPDTVTFSIGGVTIPGCAARPVTDTSPPKNDGPDNIATCTYTPTAADATAGSVTINAAYSGDEYALPSSDKETLTVSS